MLTNWHLVDKYVHIENAISLLPGEKVPHCLLLLKVLIIVAVLNY
jgi:hypothetical protein